MRAPEILFLRWLVTHLSRVLLRLNRKLLEFTLKVVGTRRDYFFARILTGLTIRFTALNSSLTRVIQRLRKYWERDF